MSEAIGDALLRENSGELYDQAPCGYLYTAPNGRIIKVNQTFLDWTGYDRADLVGRMHFADLLNPGAKIFYETHFAPSLRLHGSLNEIALDILCSSQGSIPVLVSAIEKQDQNGNPLFNRITLFNASERRAYETELLLARKSAEEIAVQLAVLNTELERSNRALQKSETHLRQVLNSLSAFVGVMTSEGILVEANRSSLNSSLVPIEDLLGKPFIDAYWWSYSPEIQNKLSLAIEKAREGTPSRYDVLVRVNESHFITMDFSLVPIVDVSGQVTHLISSGIDISDRKRMEEELKCANTSLLKSNEELGQFAYLASHDLQEPLRTMVTYTELLARRYKGRLDQDADIFIHYIVDGSLRMRDLISDLLALSQAQHSHLIWRPTDMSQALADAIANLGATIRESETVLTSDELPSVMADKGGVMQILQNLLGNAIKYRKPSEAPRIHVSAERQAGDWVFSVSDNGLGFEQSFAEHIFGVFKRLHGRSIPGTGIGLAICKRIVEAHGGRIWAESQPNVGSTFRFTLPALPEYDS